MDDKTADKAPSDISRTPEDSDLEDAAHVHDKALMRKIDMRLLPGVTLLYLMSFLDRSNVSNARIEGLTDDTNMTGNQYLTGLTLFFIGYVLFEIPCNVVLKRTTPRFWLPTLTIVFGIVATLLGVVQSMEGFFVARFALGVAECGIFPGVVSINRHVGSWLSGLTDTRYFTSACGTRGRSGNSVLLCSSLQPLLPARLEVSWPSVSPRWMKLGASVDGGGSSS